jgi:hypothetical protein
MRLKAKNSDIQRINNKKKATMLHGVTPHTLIYINKTRILLANTMSGALEMRIGRDSRNSLGTTLYIYEEL